MNVNPFSYLIEKLKSKLDKTGGTITGSNDVPLTIKSGNNTGSYVGFKASNDTYFGYIGVKSDKKPYFYDTEARRIALTSDLQPKMLPAAFATVAVGGKYYAVLGHFQSTPTISKVNVLGVGDATLSDFDLVQIDANNNYAIYTTSSSYVGKAISVYF